MPCVANPAGQLGLQSPSGFRYIESRHLVHAVPSVLHSWQLPDPATHPEAAGSQMRLKFPVPIALPVGQSDGAMHSPCHSAFERAHLVQLQASSGKAQVWQSVPQPHGTVGTSPVAPNAAGRNVAIDSPVTFPPAQTRGSATHALLKDPAPCSAYPNGQLLRQVPSGLRYIALLHLTHAVASSLHAWQLSTRAVQLPPAGEAVETQTRL